MSLLEKFIKPRQRTASPDCKAGSDKPENRVEITFGTLNVRFPVSAIEPFQKLVNAVFAWLFWLVVVISASLWFDIYTPFVQAMRP
ncbi:MAG: hypothetical protein JXR13_05660 [Thalassovita sp.]